MSRQYFVRDRGRIMGPFSGEQLFDMRDRGQIQAYHEVSTDQRTWKAFDLMFPTAVSGAANPRPSATSSRANPPKGVRRPPPDSSNRTIWIVAGSVGALVVAAGIAFGVILLVRSRTDDTAKNNPDTVPEGVIAFHADTQTRARDNAVADAVALVVPGIYVKFNDGSWAEERFGHGSGFAVGPDGHVVTNRHVVEKLMNYRNSQMRRDDERTIRGEVTAHIWVFFGRDNKFDVDLDSVHTSVDYDLAILKVKRTAPRYFALSRTEDSRIPMLDAVSSLGFPNTDQKASKILNPNQPVTTDAKNAPVQRGFLDADFNVTKENGGIKKNSFRARPDAAQLEAYYLVHTARIAPGNSGGPLVARDGTVLGINTLGILDPRSKEKIIQEGQNYALTMPQLRKEIDQRVPNVAWRDAPE